MLYNLRNLLNLRPAFLCLFLSFPLNGCSNALQSGHNTALDSVDLISMTDDMAMKLGSSADVATAFASHGALKIVVQPVQNDMTAEILAKGPADAFTARLRMLLARHSPERYIWIMNRNAFYDLRNRELEGIDPGPSPDAINPGYALTATFKSLTHEDRKRRSAYYLCVYELTNLSDRSVLWTGSYEVKKAAVKGFLD